MANFKVGIQLWPEHISDYNVLRNAWQQADALGVDSLWVWDHFYPLTNQDQDDLHFEGWTTVAAMAADTSHAMVGAMVTGTPYRNPDLLADMARTVDHISGGRAYFGMGAGWFQRDFDEFGFDFKDVPRRLRDFRVYLERVKARLAKLSPPPVGQLPIIIGGGGEKVTLRLVAEFADAWNAVGMSPEAYAAKLAILRTHCDAIGRDFDAIEKTALIYTIPDAALVQTWLDAGATHLIIGRPAPFDFTGLEALLAQRGN